MDGASIFVPRRDVIMQQERLQALTLHLYNSEEWPFSLGYQLSAWDGRTLDIAIAMMRSYHRYGENDTAFLELGRQLADYRIERKRQFDTELAALDEEARRDGQD